MTVTAAGTICLNCGAPLTGHFCSRCGQKAEAVNPTFGQFAHELLREVSDIDGKIIRTAILLLTRPGFLSREHFEGRRARYVPPIRLYLVFSVLFFAVSAFSPLSGPRISCTTCPADVRAEREAQMREAIGQWTPRAMFVLVPVFAGLVGLVTWGSTRNYPQHLYFSMHVHSAWFIAGSLAGASRLLRIGGVGQAASLVAIAYAAVYLAVALRRAYDVGWLRAGVGAIVIGATYWLLVLAAMLAIAIPTLYRASNAV